MGFRRNTVARTPELQGLLPKAGERDVMRLYVGKEFHLVFDATQTYVSWAFVYKVENSGPISYLKGTLILTYPRTTVRKQKYPLP